MQPILAIESINRILRILLVILFIGGALAWYIQFPHVDRIQGWASDIQAQWNGVALFIGGVVYAIMLSIPFIPGIELGLVLMSLFGKESILFISICTVTGLNLSFLVGRSLPRQWVITWIDYLGVTSSDIDSNNRMRNLLTYSILGHRSNNWLEAHLINYHYLVLATLFNLPANFIFGGGGGIALISGMSRIFSWKGFLMTVVIATAPVPLLVYFGLIQVEEFLRILV